MFEQRDGGAVEHREDLVEAARSTVPGVWNIVFAGVGIEVACQQQTLFGEGPEFRHKPSVGPVHGDNEVESAEVFDR